MLMSGSSPKKSGVSLYFHIPFCTRKCDYCHFYVLPDKKPLKIALMEALKLEWDYYKHLLVDKRIETVYFGGGTPYLLGAPAITEILQWISPSDEMEITLEANPENVERKSLQEYRAAGINRLSIGLQSLDDRQLGTLSRRHSAKKGLQAVEIAFDVGFNNISIDLMYDLPGQTLASWQHTIEHAAHLPITHLSLYNLTIEPHTVFFKYREALQAQLPEEEVSKNMFEMACECFSANGLHQYEISAFAKTGCMSRHNSGYWTGRPFLGFGPSAFSYWDNKRFRNVANLSKYAHALQNNEAPIDFSEELSIEGRQRELLAIALRLFAGVNLSVFEAAQGRLSAACRNSLTELTEDGYLQFANEVYQLTKKGILFYDSVASELVEV
jgi:oxygen-independent coproporphyrinogen III oxidase